MLQPTLAPAQTLTDRLRTGLGSRALGIGLALLVEMLLLLLLLILGVGERPGEKSGSIKVINLASDEPAEQSPEPDPPQPAQQAREQPVPETAPPQERAPQPDPLPAPPAPPMRPSPLPNVPAAPPPPAAARPQAPGRVYGPPDRRPPAARDSERVGTAPNGEPLYAAAWYREPREDELSGYMSTASGPGWGLIACRTVADYRVEDCVGLAEYPRGSQINRAVLAAAWRFKVRPARIGGKSQVGSWVQIRIDYSIRRQ